MRRLRVLKVIDRWGWAYHFVGREQAKYSRHEIILKPWNEAAGVLDSVDLVYLHGPNICEHVRRELPLLAQSRGIPVVGGYGGESELIYSHVDAVLCISPQTLEFANANYSCRKFFVTEGIDTDYFRPAGEPSRNGQLRVGWAGREHSEKRPHLLNQLAYPVIRKADRDESLFREDRSLDTMLDFYHAIDVLVLTSKTECMPRVILEAMSCGLPVVSTDVGNVRAILSDRWLAPVWPEAEAVAEINRRLELLTDPDRRAVVGRRNRAAIQARASWRVLAPRWDNVFSEVAR